MNKVKKNIEDIYPLSPMQEGMLFHKILDDKSDEYFEQLSCNLSGELNFYFFQKAWQKVIDRNSVLRTSFVYKKSKRMVQVVHKKVQLNILHDDLSDLNDDVKEKRIKDILLRDRKDGIDLSKVPIIKLRIIKLEEQKHKFIWNHHHIILDGWSLPLILKEVFFYYESFRKNRNDDLPPSTPYKNYITWLGNKNIDDEKVFWKNYLKDLDSPTPLVIDKLNTKGIEPDIIKKTIRIDEQTSNVVSEFVKKSKITHSCFLQAVWAIILNKYSGKDDIVFGQTVSGRPADLVGSEFIVGLLINTLPVRAKIDNHAAVFDWIQGFHNSLIELRDYEHTPLYEIQKCTDIPSKEELFKSIFVFENYPIDESVNNTNLSLSIEDIDSFERTNYPITIVSGPGKEIPIEIAFDNSKINEELVDNLLNHFKIIIEQIITNPKQKIKELKLVSNILEIPTEHHILEDIVVEFENVVKKYSEQPALVYEGKGISYNKLNQRSNEVANYLIEHRLGLEDKIGIFINRSPEMIYAILGVLKAGAAYIPIDVNYPVDRINYIINDSDLKCVLTTTNLNINIKFKYKINIDAINTANYDNPNVNIDQDNLAYLIYTSGSTGKPKGTLLTRMGLANYLAWCKKEYPLNEGKGSILHSPISFDATITSIFTPLIAGKAIYIIPENAELEELRNILINEKNFSVIKITPAHLDLLTTQLNEKMLHHLTHSLVIGGENLTFNQISKWIEYAPQTNIYNEYGPTETVVGSVVFNIKNKLKNGSVPIGKPIINTNIYILDSYLNPVPQGVPGELYINSVDIARGYLNRPDLTAEKFIPDPYSKEPGIRMYKTGDIVVTHLDGSIEFLSRKDNQVKIRGYRIELGEIENTLSDLKHISKAVVLDKINERNEKELVAFLQTTSKEGIDLSDVKHQIKNKLPDYMIPQQMVVVDEFPITNNGKIDTKKLRNYKINREESIESDSIITNETEQLILQIVKDLLKIQSVNLDDDFFELGGHSLTAAQCSARIRDIFNIDLPLKRIFESKSIKEIAKAVDEIKSLYEGLVLSKPKKYDKNDNFPLSFSQSRLWFLDKLEPLKNNYNIPSAILIEGKLDYDILNQSIQNIIDKHEILRTSYSDHLGKPFATIHNNLKFNLDIEELKIETQSIYDQLIVEKVKEIFKYIFHLQNPPLFKIKLFKISPEQHILVLVMHHIISDGWSSNIMISEMIKYYNALSTGNEIEVNNDGLEYSDYVYWQKENYSDEILSSKVKFWKDYLEGILECIDLPLDFKRPEVQTFNGETLKFSLKKNLVDRLNKFSVKEGFTNFMVFLSVYQILLSKYSNQKDVVIGTPSANRLFSEFENVVGFFANTIAIRSKINDTDSLFQHIKQTRQNVLDTFAHSDLPFEKIVDALDIGRHLSISPIFQVAFIYQNNKNKRAELNNLKTSEYNVLPEISKYDLTLNVSEFDGEINYSFEYNTDIFKKKSIIQLQSHFERLLTFLVNYPRKKIGFVDLLNEDDKTVQISKLTNIKKITNDKLCIHQVFEKIARDFADKTALTYSEFDEKNILHTSEISYSFLNQSANQISRFILEEDINRENLIAIALPRSVKLIESILGVMKAGCAFLPIDPLYPEDRIKYMLQNSGTRYVITTSFNKDVFKEFDGKVIVIDEIKNQLKKFKKDDLSLPINNEGLAYVIYTSGTTGKPKGTLLNHKGAVNLAQAQRDVFNITSKSKIFQFSSLSFDAFVWETVMALLNGASLNLVHQKIITNSELFEKVLRSLSITIITLPPSVLSILNSEMSKDLDKLSTIIVAGEHCPIELAEKWSLERQFVNAYGPTESTVCASMYEYINGNSLPIGLPINNFKLYILDKNLNIVPKGVIGELHISGVGLARGYLGEQRLTAEKFIPNPYSNLIGDRMYRSGDLVRLNDNYEIEFIGRKDNQIKLRGFRIELGEIESVLLKHNLIEEAIVMLREDNPQNKQLTAYLKTIENKEINIPEITSYLRKYLPSYMIPAQFLKIESVPLTPSNKVDYKRLPLPEEVNIKLSKKYVPPETETEKVLEEIGKKLLGLEQMSIYDNFFELGGHSLLATQFVSRVKEKLHKDITLKQLFENPTLKGIAKIIEENSKEIEETIITRQEGGKEDILSLLDEIENLSEEEAKMLLDNDKD